MRTPDTLPGSHADIASSSASGERLRRPQLTPVPASTAHATKADADETFIESVYSEYAGPLTSFVQRLTRGDRHWTEDVVQETMVRAWRNADRLVETGPKSLLPWLATVARRIVISEVRRRGCRPQEVHDTLVPVPVDDDTDQVLDRLVLTDALRTLSTVQRDAVVDTYFDGRSVEDVARARLVPTGTVKSRVYYGLRALRATLIERGMSA